MIQRKRLYELKHAYFTSKKKYKMLIIMKKCVERSQKLPNFVLTRFFLLVKRKTRIIFTSKINFTLKHLNISKSILLF